MIDVFGHRFSQVGSLYCGEDKSSRNKTGNTAAEKMPNGDDASRIAVPVQLTPAPTVLPSLSPMIPNTGAKKKMANHFLSMIQPLAPPPPTTPSPSPDRHLDIIRPALATALSAPTLPSTLFTSATPPRKRSFQDQQSSSPEKQDVGGADSKFHIGPIVSWPFFGSSRGSLSHKQPQEIDRGPWRSAEAYYNACVDRELRGVERENEGRVRVGRLRMDPDEVVVRKKKNRSKATNASKARVIDVRRPVAPTLRAGSKLRNEWGFGNVPGAKERGTPDGDGSFSPMGFPPAAFARSKSNDASSSATSDNTSEIDDSDSDSVDSDTSSSSAGSVASDEDAFYRDYRCHQRSTFLVAELQRRKETVLGEMRRWKGVMQELESILNDTAAKLVGPDRSSAFADDEGLFGLDCHDLSLDNVFVDEKDPGRIVSCLFLGILSAFELRF